MNYEELFGIDLDSLKTVLSSAVLKSSRISADFSSLRLTPYVGSPCYSYDLEVCPGGISLFREFKLQVVGYEKDHTGASYFEVNYKLTTFGGTETKWSRICRIWIDSDGIKYQNDCVTARGPADPVPLL